MIKCMPCKCKDRSSNPQNIQSQAWWHTGVIPAFLLQAHWEQEAGVAPEAQGSAILLFNNKIILMLWSPAIKKSNTPRRVEKQRFKLPLSLCFSFFLKWKKNLIISMEFSLTSWIFDSRQVSSAESQLIISLPLFSLSELFSQSKAMAHWHMHMVNMYSPRSLGKRHGLRLTSHRSLYQQLMLLRDSAVWSHSSQSGKKLWGCSRDPTLSPQAQDLPPQKTSAQACH